MSYNSSSRGDLSHIVKSMPERRKEAEKNRRSRVVAESANKKGTVAYTLKILQDPTLTTAQKLELTMGSSESESSTSKKRQGSKSAPAKRGTTSSSRPSRPRRNI